MGSILTDRDARAKVADELQGYVLQQGYFVPLTQIVQRVYVQAPEVNGVIFALDTDSGKCVSTERVKF